MNVFDPSLDGFGIRAKYSILFAEHVLSNLLVWRE